MTLWNGIDFHVSLENPILPFNGALERIVALLPPGGANSQMWVFVQQGKNSQETEWVLKITVVYKTQIWQDH